MVDWLSLAVPLAYLGILIGSLATFSSLYRKRKARMYSHYFLRDNTDRLNLPYSALLGLC